MTESAWNKYFELQTYDCVVFIVVSNVFIVVAACCLGVTCLLSARFLRHFFLTVAGLRATLSRFLEGALYKYPEWMNEGIMVDAILSINTNTITTVCIGEACKGRFSFKCRFSLKCGFPFMRQFSWTIASFIHSIVMETYIAPLKETTTQKRSQPSHGQRRTWERCKIWMGGPSEGIAAQREDHSRLMDPRPKRPFAA